MHLVCAPIQILGCQIKVKSCVLGLREGCVSVGVMKTQMCLLNSLLLCPSIFAQSL